MMIARMLLVLCPLLACATAQADAAYAGVGVNVWTADFESSAFSRTGTAPHGMDFNYGWHYKQFLSIEARAGYGAVTDNDLAVARYAGLYLKGLFRFNEKLHPYAMLGVTSATFDLGGANDARSGVSLALGADAIITRKWGIGVEYQRLLSENDGGVAVKLEGFRIGMRYLY